MRGSSLSFIIVAALCGGLFAGCEWTSSSGSSSWSGSYDDMNFSGTYRTAAVATTAPTTTAPQPISVSEKVGTYNPTKRAYSGKLRGDVVVGSVTITAGEATYVDNRSGVLTGNSTAAGNGTISYESGGWTFTAMSSPVSSGSIVAVYSFTPSSSSSPSDGITITAITVSQMGQNLTMVLSNGVTMTGRFTTVSEISGGGGYNAQFEVSSKGNKFVGTLNNASGTRVINGSWVSGSSVYDISGAAN